MKIRLAAPCTQDSIVDGDGLRMVVWTQGCPHGCKGCHNPQTHSFTGGFTMEIAEIMAQFDANPLLAGITLSGGDPFIQADQCIQLAKEVKLRGKNVWIYTGYTLEEIMASGRESWLELLMNADVLVDGPYIEELRNLELTFRGSENQRIIYVQELFAGKADGAWSQLPRVMAG